jgi:arylsulfatase A-like enzyme
MQPLNMSEQIMETGQIHRRERARITRNILTSTAFSLFLFAFTFAFYLNFSYMGVRNKEMENFIFSNLKGFLVLVNLKILAVYMVIGLIVGVFSWLLNLKRKRFILLFNAFFWFMFWIRGIKSYPQMFEEQLYRKGGLLKIFQVVITDFIPMPAMYIVFIAAIIALGVKNRRVIYAFVILLLSFLLVFPWEVAPSKAKPLPHAAAPPNLLILAVDSLRPQNLSYNGYFRKTPVIDGLLSRGVQFSNLKSSLARTLPSWTSVFTSMFPPDHQVRQMFEPEKDLRKKWLTLVDVLNRHDYYTAVISDFAGDMFSCIDYGFQEVIAPQLTIYQVLKQRSEEYHYFLLGFIFNLTGRALFPEIAGMGLNKDPWYVFRDTEQTIKKVIKKNKPFFILAFTSSNHFPYVTRYPYYQTYMPKNYYGNYKYGLSHEVLDSFLEKKPAKEEIPYVVNHYDSATLLFDHHLGGVLDFLKKCHIDNNTIVVIMSDHGENLYEEDYGMAHGNHLKGPYANNMVFGVYSPFENFNGRRIEKTARDIDIAPTLLDLLKIEIPGSFQGHSLVPVMQGKDFPGYPAYMETGVWYSPATPFIYNKLRIPYPYITTLLKVEMPSGKFSLQEKFRQRVIDAKYKAYQWNERKYIYMPGESTYREEFYINDKPLDKKDLNGDILLSFKQRMVDLFKGKFHIDARGFIRENTAQHLVNPLK